MEPTSPTRDAKATLLEVVVLLLMGVILAGVLLPTIGSMHVTSGRNRCQNNQRRLAEAVAGFVGAKGRFPGSREVVSKANGQTLSLTWIVSVFPYMDQQVAFNAIVDPKTEFLIQANGVHSDYDSYGFDANILPPFQSLICPNDSTLNANNRLMPLILRGSGAVCEESPDTSYAGNAGFLPRAGDPGDYGKPEYLVTAMRKENGIFHDLKATGKSGEVRPEQLLDGMTNTIMLTENLQANYYFFNGGIGEKGVRIPHRNRYATTFHYFYARERNEIENNPLGSARLVEDWMRPNGEKDIPARISDPYDPNTDRVYARPSSNHGSKVNVAFADCSVHSLSDKIDYHVLISLMAPVDKNADIPNRAFRVKESDWCPD